MSDIVIGPGQPEKRLYKLPRKQWWANLARVPLKVLLKLAVPIFAIWGKYPPLMVTPDDPVSPFGSGTTPGASREPTQMKLYERFGRYIGDVVWLGWRNGGYGVAYYCKPDWLKRPGIRYMDLTIDDQRFPPVRWDKELDREIPPGLGTLWLQAPDGSWMWETTRKFGPIYLITGYRLSAVAAGAAEDRARVESGWPPVPRPTRHPNMDGRPIVSIRTARTV